MPKIPASEIAKEAQTLYAPKDKNRSVIGTGTTLKRPENPEDFVLADQQHPWCKLTGLLGLPFDIVTQIAGAPDSGKSTIAAEFLAEAQKQGIYTILWDTEKKFDKNRFTKQFGGDPSELNTVTTTTIRKGAGAVFKMINTITKLDPKARILVVHDSVGGSVSRSRADREIDDEKNAQPGTEAVENSDYMRHVIATFDKYPGKIAWLLVNQMTHKIGISPGKSRSGGEKISFHSSLIVEMTRVQDVTKVVNKVKFKTGIVSRAKIAKNHLSLNENSVHEMRVLVDAKGWHHNDGDKDDESEE